MQATKDSDGYVTIERDGNKLKFYPKTWNRIAQWLRNEEGNPSWAPGVDAHPKKGQLNNDTKVRIGSTFNKYNRDGYGPWESNEPRKLAEDIESTIQDMEAKYFDDFLDFLPDSDDVKKFFDGMNKLKTTTCHNLKMDSKYRDNDWMVLLVAIPGFSFYSGWIDILTDRPTDNDTADTINENNQVASHPILPNFYLVPRNIYGETSFNEKALTSYLQQFLQLAGNHLAGKKLLIDLRENEQPLPEEVAPIVQEMLDNLPKSEQPEEIVFCDNF